MRIIEIILQNNYRTVSIVGLAKNAGKTVALNYLVGTEKIQTLLHIHKNLQYMLQRACMWQQPRMR